LVSVVKTSAVFQVFSLIRVSVDMSSLRGARRNFLRGGLKFWEKYFALTKVQATLFAITFMSYMLFQF